MVLVLKSLDLDRLDPEAVRSYYFTKTKLIIEICRLWEWRPQMYQPDIVPHCKKTTVNSATKSSSFCFDKFEREICLLCILSYINHWLMINILICYGFFCVLIRFAKYVLQKSMNVWMQQPIRRRAATSALSSAAKFSLIYHFSVTEFLNFNC